MTADKLTICERLERRHECREGANGPTTIHHLINPDGPEAAAIIRELVAALDEADHAWADAMILIAHADPVKQCKAKNALYAWRDKSKALLAKVRR